MHVARTFNFVFPFFLVSPLPVELKINHASIYHLNPWNGRKLSIHVAYSMGIGFTN